MNGLLIKISPRSKYGVQTVKNKRPTHCNQLSTSIFTLSETSRTK